MYLYHLAQVLSVLYPEVLGKVQTILVDGIDTTCSMASVGLGAD